MVVQMVCAENVCMRIVILSGVTTVGQGGQLPPAFEELETVTAALSL